MAYARRKYRKHTIRNDIAAVPVSVLISIDLRCSKHNEEVMERLESEKITPYCFSCLAEEVAEAERQRMIRDHTAIQRSHSNKKKSVFFDTLAENFSLAVMSGSGIGIFLGIVSSQIYGTVPIEGLITLSVFIGLFIILYKYNSASQKIEWEKVYEVDLNTTKMRVMENLKYTALREKDQVENFKKKVYRDYIQTSANIKELDNLAGLKFEDFMASHFRRSGYTVQQTPASGDNGVDLIISKNGRKIAVQCKRYKGAVSNKAIQEVYSGKDFYKCNEALVVTTSYFTEPAKTVAKGLRVNLWDRDELIKELSAFQRSQSWQEIISGYYDFSNFQNKQGLIEPPNNEEGLKETVQTTPSQEEKSKQANQTTFSKEESKFKNASPIEKNQTVESKHIRHCKHCGVQNWVYVNKLDKAICGHCKKKIL